MQPARRAGIEIRPEHSNTATLQPFLVPGILDAPAERASEMRLPSFFIVGPPRTGSSWLHRILSGHAVLPSPAKETRFFDEHFHRGLQWYMAHYRGADGKSGDKRRVGEVAPTYFASAEARGRIAQTVPQAKIVCVFRNPVDRIVSLYRLKRAYGLISWNFEQAVEQDPELMATSRYAENLRMWQAAFGEQNVMAALYDDLLAKPQGFLNDVLDFIGVPRFALSAADQVAVHDSDRMTCPRNYYATRAAVLAADWFKSKRLDRVVWMFRQSPLQKLVLGGGQPFPRMTPSTLGRLREKLRPEIERMEELLVRDLSVWKKSA
jgi:LPS sulfotransferase NodH